MHTGVFGAASLVGGLVGSHATRRLVRCCGRPSLLVFMFVALLVLATAAEVAFPMRQAIQGLAEGQGLQLTSLCATNDPS